jgi:hypothetical protein
MVPAASCGTWRSIEIGFMLGHPFLVCLGLLFYNV